MREIRPDLIKAHADTRFRSEYDYALFEYYRSAKVLAFLERAGVDVSGRILDAGCGGGGMPLSLAEHASLVVGIDPIDRFGQAGVTLGRERGLSNLQFAQADGMAAARAGRPLRHIGRAVQRRARRSGFGVVADLCGHGVGRHIHEEPSVPGVEVRWDRTVLWEGLVIAIEPFLSTGSTSVTEADDGWTLRTVDGSRTAQFEHTVVVTHGEPLVLTASAA